MKSYLLNEIHKLPITPGVYLFKDIKEKILYIGKAKNLQKRISSYFKNNKDAQIKIKNMVSQAVKVDIINLSTEFEALLLESKLINQIQPKYNSVWRDDKHYIYLKITKEQLPRILLSRKEDNEGYYFGPFASSKTIKEIIYLIRAIFPYCTASQKIKKPCFYTHLGLCNPCPGQIIDLNGKTKIEAIKHYRDNIKQIKKIMSGEINNVKKFLYNQMTVLSSQKLFEEAAVYRDKFNKLDNLINNYQSKTINLTDPILWESGWNTEKKELLEILGKYYNFNANIDKIECFDVSNISGKYAVGAMVAFEKGQPCKNLYRRFKIQTKNTPDDFSMIAEILFRRFKHDEWLFPQLIILDGGKPQLIAGQKVLSMLDIKIPMIGLVKKKEEIVIYSNCHTNYILLDRRSYALRLIQRLRDESHRFAHNYNTLLRLKSLFT